MISINLKIFFLFMTGILLGYLIISFSKNLKVKNIISVQDLHEGYIPRTGGALIVLIFYLGLFLLAKNSSYLTITFLFCGLSIFIIGFIEDLIRNLNPNLRLIIILISSFLLLINFENLPKIELPYLDFILLNFYFANLIFFILGLAALINGMNIIDGTNGLTAITSLSSLICILYLNSKFSLNFDFEIILLLISIVIFLFFNFPLAKLFLGDGGAYWLGWLIGTILIYIFSKINISTWGAYLIIFYPSTEVIFSFLRKSLNKNSPFKPDTKHIHIMTYSMLKHSKINKKYLNPLVTLVLFPFWLFPPIFFLMASSYSQSYLIYIFILLIIYFFYFLFLINLDKKST